jgi:hypothetical protein
MMRRLSKRHSRLCPGAKRFLFLILFFACIGSSAFALDPIVEPSSGNVQDSEETPVLKPVIVVGTVENSATGKSSFGDAQISVLPSKNGNATDLLRLLPGVQTSNEANSSLRAGEIIPSMISISGGRPYQNNVMINGMGNNSLLDPLEENPNMIETVPGHAQELFLNSHLVDEITVYDNNIPARFGGFNGGVVDISTRDPDEQFRGNLHLRTTRDSWSSFHVEPTDRDQFINSTSQHRQPRFTKYDGGIELDIPITKKTGLLASYQYLYSRIPLVLITETVDQKRFSENYLLKLVHRLSRSEKVTLEAIHSPYVADYFTRDTMNSAFKIYGGGTSLLAAYEQQNGEGHFDARAGFRMSENSRNAPTHFRSWSNSNDSDWTSTDPATNDWGTLIGRTTSNEGGFGDVITKQQTFEVNIDWLSEKHRWGVGSHQFNAGVQWSHARAEYDRPQTSYSYRTSLPTSIPDPGLSCGVDTYACIPGEQFLSFRSVYPATNTKFSLNDIAIYLEDLFILGRFDLRAGLRVSHNDLMQNTDVAPRLAATYDLFDNGNTLFVGGWNRYFDKTLLTYKLREAIPLDWRESRTLPVDNNSEWSVSGGTTGATQFTELSTPHTDEFVVGFDQALFNSYLKFRYVRRDFLDQLAKERDPFGSTPRYSRLNNNGESHYESYRLSWDRTWSEHFLFLNANYSVATTTNESYDASLELTDLEPAERIWFQGELLWPDEIPRDDFNRNWVVNLIYSAKLPYDFMFTNTTNYRSGYKNIEKAGGDPVNISGVDYVVYKRVKRPSSVIFDWRIDWHPPAIPEKALTVTLEILNVFDKRVTIGGETDEYELGRQFWAGFEYTF